VLCLVAQSCPTLCNPMDCNLPGSSVHRILQARILEWVAMPSSRGSSQPRDRTKSLRMSWVLLTFKSSLRNCTGDCIPLWSGFSGCPESHHFTVSTPGHTLLYKVPLWKLEKSGPSFICCSMGTGLGGQFETSNKSQKNGTCLSGWMHLHQSHSSESGEWAGCNLLELPWQSDLLKSAQHTLWPLCPILPLVFSPRSCLTSWRWERRNLFTEVHPDVGEENQKSVCWTSWMCRLIFSVHFGKCSVILTEYTFFPFLSLFSFWDSHYAYCDILSGVPQVSEAFFTFIILFSFCSSDCIILIDLFSSLLILSFARSNLLLSPSTELSLSDYNFQMQNFHCLIFIMSISSLIFSNEKLSPYLPLII